MQFKCNLDCLHVKNTFGVLLQLLTHSENLRLVCSMINSWQIRHLSCHKMRNVMESRQCLDLWHRHAVAMLQPAWLSAFTLDYKIMPGSFTVCLIFSAKNTKINAHCVAFINGAKTLGVTYASQQCKLFSKTLWIKITSTNYWIIWCVN